MTSSRKREKTSRAIDRCLRALGPHLLRASTAADSMKGLRPRDAIPALREAERILSAAIERLETAPRTRTLAEQH